MGLISKAIKKLDKKENPATQQETPPQPRTKKRFLTLLAALLFVGASLGLGYLFLLKPATKVPPPAVRRSIGAKKIPAKPAAVLSEQKKDTVQVNAVAGKKGATSKETLRKSPASQKPTEKAGIASEQPNKAPAPRQETPAFVSESGISSSSDEPNTPDSSIQQPLNPPSSSTCEEEDKISADLLPDEPRHEDSPEYVADETPYSQQREISSDEDVPSYVLDLKKWLTQKTFTVAQRSDSRAQKYYSKGVSYQQQGEFNRAINSYRKALTFNPDHVQAHINLAAAYLQMGRFKEAEQELIYVYALKPKDCQILFNFGLLMYQIGEYTSAETKLKKLLKLDPFHLDANLLLASVYEERGEVNQAVEFCMKAYRINSADPRVLYRAGRAWDMAGEPTKALEYYRLFLNKCPERESELKSAVRDRLNYLVWREEKK